MKINLNEFNISQNVLIEKVKKDIQFGIRIKAGALDDSDLIRVWTDAPNWQFSIIAILDKNAKENLSKLDIQSFGTSKHNLNLSAIYDKYDLQVNLSRLSSKKFAEFSEVDKSEVQSFLEGYMVSTVNRDLTKKLFNNFSNEEVIQKWLKI